MISDNSANTFYLLWAGSLVFFMQGGFAMLEAGIVQSKNVKNILVKNMLDIAIAGIIWFLFGYGLAYGGTTGEERDWFTGHAVGAEKKLFALHLDHKDEAITEGASFVSWFFQYAFCAVAGTIVSGAVAERTKIEAYLIYTVVITGFIYPVVVHWGWSSSGGFSASNGQSNGNGPYEGGALDFAGSTIVHMTGGVAGLVGSYMVGPRKGRFDGGKVNPMPMNNFTLIALGTIILWFGWYGFNCGSTLNVATANSMATAARVAVTTTLSPSACAIVVTVFRKFSTGVWDLGAVCNGILGGLVSITAGCAAVDPWVAIIIGIIGGFVYLGASNLLLKLKIDDPLDAFAVHGACGAWGTLAVGLFTPKHYTWNQNKYCGGFMSGCDGKLFGIQLVFVLAVFTFVALSSFVMFWTMNRLNLLRVSDETEELGLDNSEHGGNAYTINEEGKSDGSVPANSVEDALSYKY